MRLNQYAIKKEICCACSDPYEISTERDFCQRCHKPIWEPTWTEYFENRLQETLAKSTLCEQSKGIIKTLVSRNLQHIYSDSDIEKAQKELNNLDKLMVKQ
jgi:hypothetical protein